MNSNSVVIWDSADLVGSLAEAYLRDYVFYLDRMRTGKYVSDVE